MAGLCRRFLVYPTHAVWPTSLVTIALNATLHSDKDDEPVKGPFNRMFKMGRMRAFVILFVGMFVYFWVRPILPAPSAPRRRGRLQSDPQHVLQRPVHL